MRIRCSAFVITLAVAMATVFVGMVEAQNPAGTKAAVKKSRKGGLLAPGGAKGKALGREADPLAKQSDATAKSVKEGAFHYSFRLLASDGTPLAANYYPSKLGTGSSVVMLVHEKDRSVKDFEDKISDFANRSLAEGLQKDGYAVLAVDLRGHGANTRRAMGGKDWQLMVADLQSAYVFLVDRHNRGEINLARLGLVALGEGANLVSIWANLPGGAVSSQGRASDLGGLVLISPMIDGKNQGLRAQQPMTALAPRVPICLLSGEKDALSAELVTAVKPAVTRVPKNKVEVFPSSLHGFKLLRLEPNVTGTITRFFGETIKAKPEEWEPRYNLDPVTYGEVKVVPNADDSAKPETPTPAIEPGK
jgi:pimeloyl-ACP methyl ester carboxylesterase